MRHTISCQLDQARLTLRRRPRRPGVRPLTRRTVPFALIAAALRELAVGVLAPRASAGTAVGAGSGGAMAFVPIVEPFDLGHPARTVPDPGHCYARRSTVDIEQCLDTKTENTDARIDAAQRARFRRSAAAAKAATCSPAGPAGKRR